jgi:hypothetical protein
VKWLLLLEIVEVVCLNARNKNYNLPVGFDREIGGGSLVDYDDGSGMCTTVVLIVGL